MLLVAAAATTELSAEGYQVNNLSTRQTGMGHVGTAMKLNSESIFFNPAGAAFQDSKFDLSVGASGILSYCTYTPAPAMDNGFYAGAYTSWDSDNRMSTPLYAYFNYKPTDRIAVGLGFFTPDGSCDGFIWFRRSIWQPIRCSRPCRSRSATGCRSVRV